ncbi:hypothetical protein G7054_g14874 [Neopestalotiopsis clavispora]|nr:hypothetical protein G7054_g14874 [Neopestalotiopsis clavispora]
MKRRRKSAALWLALSICAFLPQTLADCECGYSVVTGDGDNDNDGGTHVFTDLLEADFVHVDYVGAGATTKDWATQTYNMSSQAARGSYGESFGAAEVDKDLVEDANIWTGDGADGDDVGLKLMVRSETVDGMIEGGQVATTAGDYFWGSYRARNMQCVLLVFQRYAGNRSRIPLEGVQHLGLTLSREPSPAVAALPLRRLRRLGDGHFCQRQPAL